MIRPTVTSPAIARAATQRDVEAPASLGADHAAEPGRRATVAARFGLRRRRLRDRADLFLAPYALGQGRETHTLTAAVTALTVEALLGETPRRVHVPASAGRPGGYPALLSRAGVELDLPDGLSEPDARAVNAVAARWDGIEQIAADGTVTFTAAVADTTQRVLGHRLERVAVDEHDAIADELTARMARTFA